MTTEEFNLSKKKWVGKEGYLTVTDDVKEFFRKILTPNNISKGYVETSTILYFAGEGLTKT